MAGSALRALSFVFFILVTGSTAHAAGAERPAALDASLGEYAVISPIFTGQGGNTSYIRLVNNAATDSGEVFISTTYTIQILGAETGTVYGTASIEAPAFASPQYSIHEILELANAAPLSGGDVGYSLYVQNPNLGTGFMHVIYNGTNGFFENASTCQAYVQAEAEAKHLFNVHTSVIATYPSQIYLHNYAGDALDYRITVRDARTGTTVGSTVVQLAANTTRSMSFASIEQLLGWTPVANQQHVNVTFEAVEREVAPILVSTFITNQVMGTSVNMSSICQVNEIVTDDDNGGSGGTDGTDGSGGTTPFALTVTKAGTGTGAVTSSPTGIDCGALCPNRAFDFDPGTVVSLAATAANGATFQGWSGACTGTGICNVTMNAAKSVTATFEPSTHSLTVSVVGSGNVVSTPVGINCGALGTACTFDGFGFGNTVSLQALSHPGSTVQGVIGWSGCSSTSGNNGSICNIAIIGAQSVTAAFQN